MDAATKNSVILAAINAAGPKGDDSDSWLSDVTANALEITTLLSEHSPVSKAIDTLENCKVFVATIQAIKKEASSTRAVVVLKTRPSNYNKDGLEHARTERTDNPEGMAMAQRLKALKGHRVRIWIEIEEYSNDNGAGKVRIVRHVQDLGRAEDGDA